MGGFAHPPSTLCPLGGLDGATIHPTHSSGAHTPSFFHRTLSGAYHPSIFTSCGLRFYACVRPRPRASRTLTHNPLTRVAHPCYHSHLKASDADFHSFLILTLWGYGSCALPLFHTPGRINGPLRCFLRGAGLPSNPFALWHHSRLLACLVPPVRDEETPLVFPPFPLFPQSRVAVVGWV